MSTLIGGCLQPDSSRIKIVFTHAYRKFKIFLLHWIQFLASIHMGFYVYEAIIIGLV